MANNQYHVYVDKKPCGEPFYVGKGKSKRVKHISRNELHTNICAKYPDWQRDVVFSGTEAECFAEEIRLISLYGRRDLETGTLANMTDGGDGASGNIQSEYTIVKRQQAISKYWDDVGDEARRKRGEQSRAGHTAEAKVKMSEASILRWERWRSEGKTYTAETRAKMSKSATGRTASSETKAKMSATRKGRKPSDETKARMSEAKRQYWANKRSQLEMNNG